MYSKAFKSATITATFNAVIERDAATGRIPAILLLAVEKDYGLTLSPKVREFVATLNTDFQSVQKVKLIPLVQVLHQCATAVLESGMVKSPPALLALPEWADPKAIEAKRVEDKAARAAKREAAAAAGGAAAGGAEGEEGEGEEGEVQSVPDVAATLSLLYVMLDGGQLSAEQISTTIAKLETAQRAPVPAKTIAPAVRKARKQRVAAAAQAIVEEMTA